ncbi:MAG: 3-deoxy-manno-octulosonate cytidylyltransferase [Myxococcaceae bacterium]|nr:3-deoxy-manno-octulosonate cytidylyltransferase [Myxococcaceae bacterium]
MYRFAVIPARWASTRFPGKPLAKLEGKPMVEHVYRRCEEARCFDSIAVATDDDRIVEAVRAFGGVAVRTSPACVSGTDRAAEVVSTLSRVDVVVNVQGDEPALPPHALRTVALAFDDAAVELCTLVRPLAAAERQNPNVVKVVLDEGGHALYFSRADVPFARADTQVPRWAHVGLYGYRRDVLLKLAALPPTLLEQTESLEQLRALGAGIRIACRRTDHRVRGVDVPEDVADAEEALRQLSAAAR